MSLIATPHPCGFYPCASCGGAAGFKCDWPAERPRPTVVHDIRHGDILLSPQSKRPCVVIDITARIHAPKLTIWVEYRHGRRRPPYPGFGYEREPLDTMLVLRPGRCDYFACDNCVREVAEGRHHCAACWNAWKETAA